MCSWQHNFNQTLWTGFAVSGSNIRAHIADTGTRRPRKKEANRDHQEWTLSGVRRPSGASFSALPDHGLHLISTLCFIRTLYANRNLYLDWNSSRNSTRVLSMADLDELHSLLVNSRFEKWGCDGNVSKFRFVGRQSGSSLTMRNGWMIVDTFKSFFEACFIVFSPLLLGDAYMNINTASVLLKTSWYNVLLPIWIKWQLKMSDYQVQILLL